MTPLLLTFLLLVLSAISSVAQTQQKPIQREALPATVTLKNGEILQGNLVDLGMIEVEILVGDVHKKIRLLDVARLDFQAEPVSLPQSNNKAAGAAVKALRKLESAVSVGVNFQEYGTRVADAKIAVDEAMPDIPDGEVKDAINKAMEDYAQALKEWNGYIQDGRIYGGQNFWWTLARAYLDKAAKLLGASKQ